MQSWNAYAPGTQELLIRAIKKWVFFCKEEALRKEMFCNVPDALVLKFMHKLYVSVSAKVVEGTLANVGTVYGLLDW